MPTHSPAVDRDRLLTQAVAQKHGALRDLTCATTHSMQSIELSKRPRSMKTTTQEGCKTCWASMQYTVAFDAVDASHATMIYCVASGVMAGFMQAWQHVSPPKQSTIQCQPKPPQKGSGSL